MANKVVPQPAAPQSCDDGHRAAAAHAGDSQPATLMRQIAQPLPQRMIVRAARLVANHRPARRNDPARPQS